jgi:hypothetical protein
MGRVFVLVRGVIVGLLGTWVAPEAKDDTVTGRRTKL